MTPTKESRFDLLYRTKDSPLRYWQVKLIVGREQKKPIDLGTDYTAGLDWLREHGYTETHWNWEDRRYLGGNNVWGKTQQFWVHVAFRNPETGQSAWLDYKSEEKR
jgi:hypothetical protein